MKRFLACLAVASAIGLLIPPPPLGRPWYWHWPEGRLAIYDVFFPLAGYVCGVLVLAVALYAAVLLVDRLRKRWRS